ncbi:opacity protein-like surface antigen [Dysgonomonas sp. PFB1-18]|uniref:outer membrane beta-barrel protein n=1 Tax=unclassified Dysgonomonas TaxID=2630389 RepID=UPI002476863C|nr:MULTISPECIES: outer membrane beta-barrel protein [unclassified Dysgonomonas]MDH6308140.1 opacity protein-like surface antigen [Dysgonomonas sp. PF1-14]MDH6339679.1 opacity protein-like surface antigen [Dysgonomonas sp. PF1-16]MDH6381330.1 opacity protein-like surface antigen [Dysgonomonas sp. PFB1-18]MDH6398542.1 opacity protein-like surface antigen [Dysgonomonas sp. PF1-23]
MRTNCYSAIVLLFLLSVFNIHSSSAQIRFGVRGGVDVISNKLDFKILKASNRLGYHIGPTLEFIVPASGFGADVAVLYGRKEYKIQDKESDASISDYDYISIPVNIKQRFNILAIGVFVTGGVYGNVKVSGGDINNIGDVVDEYKAKNFIFGLGAGAGVTILKHVDLGIYFRGDLTKRYGDEYMDAGVFQNKKNQTWTVGLSYYF